ncbi:unnamed protein product [Rotaria socialis]|uniref:PIPK domain-containing protein n=1 Tax=Rotaria socialis TaxID=392032 RepID=A0A820JIT2_9BILA|nr:unnamed protein product [Rotaria socialis]CAF4455397.1 unnamed protein product [Rotaria socialis]
MNDDSQDGDGLDIGKKHKLGHLRVDTQGKATFKHLPTNQLVEALQLGIQYSVGGLEARPAHDVLFQDFLTVELINFPKSGRTQTPKATPPHRFNDFTIRSYAPVAFRHFREKFNIRPVDYLSSICKPFRELKNPGASGSLFYLTADDEFIIKTVQKKEASFLRSLLPGYYMNVTQNQRTLLPKFFGLYCYQGDNKNIRITVMNNLIPSRIQMHEKYDLKGSTYKRRANSEERLKQFPTWKDLDFMERHPKGLTLDSETYAALAQTVERDCRVLESFQIMDYSFLIGIHYANHHSDSPIDSHGTNGFFNDPSSPQPPRMMYATPMDNIHAEFEEHNRPDDAQLAKTGGIPAQTADGQRVYLYVGIIDILQSYQLRKKLEHTFKSVLTDGSQISVTHPRYYSGRYQKFLFNNVFKKAPPRQSGGNIFVPPQSSLTTTTPSLRSLYGMPYMIPSKLLESSSGSVTPMSRSTAFDTSFHSSQQSDRRTNHGSSTTVYASSHQSDSLYNQPTRKSTAKVLTTTFDDNLHHRTDNQRTKFYQNLSAQLVTNVDQRYNLMPNDKTSRHKLTSSAANVQHQSKAWKRWSDFGSVKSDEGEAVAAMANRDHDF